MRFKPNTSEGWADKVGIWLRLAAVYFASLLLAVSVQAAGRPRPEHPAQIPRTPSPRSAIDLRNIPYKIVYETYRVTAGRKNWELFITNADGSEKINLTKTPYLDEMYPHVSPDATRICFVVDQGTGRRKIRSVYYMNIDGSSLVRVARNARQPCWSPDGRYIAYLRGEYERYSTREYATSELMIYELESGRHYRHPNKTIHHMYAICWSPDSRWFLGVVHGGMEYSDAVLALEADGTRVFDLKRWGVVGCRPDFSPEGKRIAWGKTDWELCIADIDFSSGVPRVFNVREILGCLRSKKVYHVDFSPDGKYLAFSYGPTKGGQQVGGLAPGWDICIADMTGTWVKVTTDGNHNKEPDWVPIPTPPSENRQEKSPLERILSHPLVRQTVPGND